MMRKKREVNKEIKILKRKNNLLKKKLTKQKKETKIVDQQLVDCQKEIENLQQILVNDIKLKGSQTDQFFKLSLDLVGIANFDGYFLDVNPMWEKKLGYSKQELLSKPYHHFIHPEDVNKTLQTAQHNAQGNHVINFENRYRCRDGNYIWLRWMGVAIVEKKIIYAIGHDITDQKQLEADLKASQSELLSIIESLPGGIVYADKDIRFLYVNHNYELWVEKTKEEMLGKYIWEVLGEKAYQTVKHSIARVLRGEYSSYEGKLPIYNGKVYDVDARLVPKINSQGEVEGYYALVFDVTDRVKAQAKIRLQWTAIESAIDGISIIKNNRFEYVNNSKLRIFGYENPQEIIGKSWLKLYPISSKNRFKQEIIPLLNSQKFWQGEVIATRKDGTNFIEEVSLTLIDNNIIVAVCRDISERKQSEEALRIAEETYRSLFENALEGIFQSTPEGYYLKVNPAMAKIHGYQSPEDMINRIQSINQQIYVDSKIRDEFQLLLQEKGEINNFEYQVYRQDGRIIWLQENTRAVVNNQGKVLYYEGIIQDITERKRKQAILAKQIQELSISIDENQRRKMVNNILASEEFQQVRNNVNNLRNNG